MGREETSRFPCKKCHRVPGVSDHAEPVCGLAMASATVLPSRFTHPVGARKSAFAAQYSAHDSPRQRFTADLAVSGAWRGAGAAGYAFTVWNLHPLLLAGFPAHGQSGEGVRDKLPEDRIDGSPQFARGEQPWQKRRRSALRLTQTVVFLSYFKGLKDPRQRGKVDYPLDEILLLCLVAVLAEAETMVDIALFG